MREDFIALIAEARTCGPYKASDGWRGVKVADTKLVYRLADEIERLHKNKDRFFDTIEWFEKVVIDKDAEIERLKEVMMDTWGWLDKNNLGTTAHGARLLKEAQ